MQRFPSTFASGPRAPTTRVIRYVRHALDRRRSDLSSPFPGTGVGYSQNDPNSFPQDQVYSEGTIFGDKRGLDLRASGMQQSARTNAVMEDSNILSGKAGGYQNPNHMLVIPVPNDVLSGQVLPFNPKRILLTLQNQDAGADLYFQFGTGVSSSGGGFTGLLLGPGQGYTFDNSTAPSDSLYFAWSTLGAIGIVMEGVEGPKTSVHLPARNVGVNYASMGRR